MEPLYVLDFLSTLKIDPNKSITDLFMFDGASNVQLAGKLMKIQYTKISVICGFEHTVFFIFQQCFQNPGCE